MSTAKTINKSWKANSQNSNFTLFHNCKFSSFSCKSRSESDPHVINVCPLSLKKSINYPSFFLSFAIYLTKGTTVHPESFPHWLGWWYSSGVVSDSSSLGSSSKVVVDVNPLLVFKASSVFRAWDRSHLSLLVRPRTGSWSGQGHRWALNDRCLQVGVCCEPSEHHPRLEPLQDARWRAVEVVACHLGMNCDRIPRESRFKVVYTDLNFLFLLIFKRFWGSLEAAADMLFLFKNYLVFNWRIIALQNFVVFCQISTWINHRYTYIPSLLNLPPMSLPMPPL